MAPNEKVALAMLLSRSWRDPGCSLNIGIIGSLVASTVGGAWAWRSGKKWAAPLPLLGCLGLYEMKHKFTPAAPMQGKYITFKDEAAKKR